MEAQVSETRRIHRGIFGRRQRSGRLGGWGGSGAGVWSCTGSGNGTKGVRRKSKKSPEVALATSGNNQEYLSWRWWLDELQSVWEPGAPATPGLCRATLRTQETKTQAGSTEKYHTQSPNHDMNGNTQGEQQTVHTTVWPQGRRLYRATEKTLKAPVKCKSHNLHLSSHSFFLKDITAS